MNSSYFWRAVNTPIALPVKLIVQDNSDMEGRSEMKGRGNYKTGKTPDKIRKGVPAEEDDHWDTTLKHSDTRLICQTRCSRTVLYLEWDMIIWDTVSSWTAEQISSVFSIWQYERMTKRIVITYNFYCSVNHLFCFEIIQIAKITPPSRRFVRLYLFMTVTKKHLMRLF